MEHLQFGVLLDENVTLKKLQQFPVVCLPNTDPTIDSLEGIPELCSVVLDRMASDESRVTNREVVAVRH